MGGGGAKIPPVEGKEGCRGEEEEEEEEEEEAWFVPPD